MYQSGHNDQAFCTIQKPRKTKKQSISYKKTTWMWKTQKITHSKSGGSSTNQAKEENSP